MSLPKDTLKQPAQKDIKDKTGMNQGQKSGAFDKSKTGQKPDATRNDSSKTTGATGTTSRVK